MTASYGTPCICTYGCVAKLIEKSLVTFLPLTTLLLRHTAPLWTTPGENELRTVFAAARISFVLHRGRNIDTRKSVRFNQRNKTDMNKISIPCRIRDLVELRSRSLRRSVTTRGRRFDFGRRIPDPREKGISWENSVYVLALLTANGIAIVSRIIRVCIKRYQSEKERKEERARALSLSRENMSITIKSVFVDRPDNSADYMREGGGKMGRERETQMSERLLRTRF